MIAGSLTKDTTSKTAETLTLANTLTLTEIQTFFPDALISQTLFPFDRSQIPTPHRWQKLNWPKKINPTKKKEE